MRDRAEERQKEIAAQDKELKAQAEERFKTAVTALGDEKESIQIGGAILLRSFLNPDDKEIYRRYYTQIFDLAVANLCPTKTSNPPEDLNTALPLTTLRQALIAAFKEVFPLARSQNKGSPQSLDASYIQLDNGYLQEADLKQAWMPQATLRNVHLVRANLNRANLLGTNLSGATLDDANLSSVVLSSADLSRVILNETNLEDAVSLEGTNLRGVKGLTKEQLKACKAKGAIIEEDTTFDSPQSDV